MGGRVGGVGRILLCQALCIAMEASTVGSYGCGREFWPCAMFRVLTRYARTMAKESSVSSQLDLDILSSWIMHKGPKVPRSQHAFLRVATHISTSPTRNGSHQHALRYTKATKSQRTTSSSDPCTHRRSPLTHHMLSEHSNRSPLMQICSSQQAAPPLRRVGPQPQCQDQPVRTRTHRGSALNVRCASTTKNALL